MTSGGFPKLTVVMATKNSERHLASALDSVAAQTFQDLEVVVVDGGSTDRTVEIAQRYPKTTVVAQAGTGLSMAWNEGISVARGDLIAFLDSDDIWLPRKLEDQAACFATKPETDCVVGKVEFFLEPGDRIPLGFKPELLDGSHVAYMPGTATMRRALFDRMGKFETRWKIAGDLVWFDRLRKTGAHIEIIDGTVLRKRIHGANLSYTSWSIYRAELFEHLRNSIMKNRHSQASTSDQ